MRTSTKKKKRNQQPREQCKKKTPRITTQEVEHALSVEKKPGKHVVLQHIKSIIKLNEMPHTEIQTPSYIRVHTYIQPEPWH